MIITLILFFVILGVTVLVHEFGHFIFAKMFGVDVFEFSIGMGPALFSHQSKKSETKYSIRAIPLGGFCSLAGEDPDEKELVKTKGRNIQDKPLIKRFLIMFMGVGFNFIFAFLVLFAVGLIYGAPSKEPIITGVASGYPAEAAGIEAGDKVLKINNHKVTFLDDVSLYSAIDDMSKSVTIEVMKSNKTIKTYVVTPKKETTASGKTAYYLGVELKPQVKRGLFESIKYAFYQEGALFKQMYTVLASLFTGKVSVKELSGPVGIYSIVGSARKQGAETLLYLVALLCVNVGVINLLPFPAFDGGRILFLIIEKLKGSPVSPKVENTIHAIGFILLILLMIFVTLNDILRLF